MIDIRSDTVTQPTQEMRDTILTCEVGDDVYEDDPTVNNFQNMAASKLHKEAALFFPSGIMANQAALISVLAQKGDEVYISKESHMHSASSQSLGIVVGAVTRFLKTDDKTEEVDITHLIDLIKKKDYDFYSRSASIVLENPTSNGLVISQQNMKEVYQVAQQYKLHLHLDGARIFNAAHHLGVEVDQISQYCDSVMVCISKGLCAPVGSILAGTKEFIRKARRIRKMLGGTMRQVGVLASCGLVALDKMIEPLKVDNEMAIRLASGLKQYKEYIDVEVDKVQINMVKCSLKQKIELEDMRKFFLNNNIKIRVKQDLKKRIRFMTHHYVRAKEIDQVIQVFEEYFEHLSSL